MKFEKFFYVILSTAIVVVILFISFVVPPFSSRDAKNYSIKKIYYVDHISVAHQKVIDLFNQKYSGQIEVKAINLSFDKFSTNERKELLARYLRSKSDRIDIFSVDQIWVPRFAKWGIPMEANIHPNQRNNLLSYAMESCRYNDSLVAVPLYIDIAVMFYRKKMLENLPDFAEIKSKLNNSITWEELIKLNSKLSNDKNPFFTFQADDYEGLLCIFTEMMASLNKPLVINDTLQLNSKEAEKALQFLVDLVHKYKMSPKEVTHLKENPSYAHFINNNGVFLRGWPSFYSIDVGALKGISYSNEIVGIPTPHFEGEKRAAVFGGWNLMISKYSSNIAEAIKFVNFLLSEEAQKTMYEEGYYLPVNTALYEDHEFLKKHPEVEFYKEYLKTGFHRPFLEKYTNISDILSYYLNAAISKKMGVREALAEAAIKINSESILLK